MRVELSDEAGQDLRDIRAYLEPRTPKTVDRTISAIVQRIDQIPDFPRAGSIVGEYRLGRVRQLIVGDYRILYTVGQDTVTVTAVVHVARAL